MTKSCLKMTSANHDDLVRHPDDGERSMTTKELVAKLEALPDLEVEILIDGKFYGIAEVLDAKEQHRAITLLIAQTTH
jgi:hypothetical protein